MKRRNFWVSFSPGSAEALVRWGGKIKYILIADFLGNTCVKNCRNRSVYVKIIASCKGGTFFETQCIWGSAISSPASLGGARPPNAFWCNSQPKICKSVEVLPTCTKRPSNILMTFPECRFCPCCELLQWAGQSRLPSTLVAFLKPNFAQWRYKISHFISTCSFRQC